MSVDKSLNKLPTEAVARPSVPTALQPQQSTQLLVPITQRLTQPFGTYYTAVNTAKGTYCRTVNIIICSGKVLSVVSTNKEIPTALESADNDLLSANIVKLLCLHTYTVAYLEFKS